MIIILLLVIILFYYLISIIYTIDYFELLLYSNWSDAVINIRSIKLPNPKEIGNAGSFFKNSEISSHRFKELKQVFPTIVGYQLPNNNVKLAAGWLIEQCGPKNGTSWKGFRNGDAGCHGKQALVLVNYGNAKGNEIYTLSTQIVDSVKEKFGVELEREVNII